MDGWYAWWLSSKEFNSESSSKVSVKVSVAAAAEIVRLAESNEDPDPNNKTFRKGKCFILFSFFPVRLVKSVSPTTITVTILDSFCNVFVLDTCFLFLDPSSVLLKAIKTVFYDKHNNKMAPFLTLVNEGRQLVFLSNQIVFLSMFRSKPKLSEHFYNFSNRGTATPLPVAVDSTLRPPSSMTPPPLFYSFRADSGSTSGSLSQAHRH